MSKRVVPTKQGWWRCFHNYSSSDEQIVHVLAENESLVFYGGLFAGFLPVSSPCVTWVAAVPSAEAVQAAVAALKANNDFMVDCYILDEETDSLMAVNNNAIAGLTGGEG